MSMVELTDDVLENFVRHAVRSGSERNPRPLLADRVELLVAEVRRGRARVADLEADNARLRAAIEQHRDDFDTTCQIEDHVVRDLRRGEVDERLWAALENNDGASV